MKSVGFKPSAQYKLVLPNILLGETRTLCVNAKFYVDEPFNPVADDSVFTHALSGCCTGNGHKYTLTFNSPHALLYSTVTFAYNIAGRYSR